MLKSNDFDRINKRADAYVRNHGLSERDDGMYFRMMIKCYLAGYRSRLREERKNGIQ